MVDRLSLSALLALTERIDDRRQTVQTITKTSCTATRTTASRSVDCIFMPLQILTRGHDGPQLIRENAPASESITGMCYRPILVLSGILSSSPSL
eukprot:2392642-Rhodomonas_salina.2